METSPDAPEAPEKPSTVSFGLQSRDVVPMLALVAGVAATFSGNQPTGNSAADFVWSFVFAASLVWLGQFADPRAFMLSAVLVLFFSGLQVPALIFGALSIVAAMTITVWRPFDRDSWAIGAGFAAAMAAQAILYLPNLGFSLSASLLAAVAIAPLAITGFRRLPADHLRIARRAAFTITVFAVVASVLTLIAALSVRSQIVSGIERAESGITAVEQGAQPEALVLLDMAQSDFDKASARLRGPLTWPARWVPIAAQHSRALETAARQGAALVSTAARTVTQADVDKIRGQNGRLDLALVEAVNAELNLASRTLAAARVSLQDVNSPWLVPLLSSRLASVNEELAATGVNIDLANHGTAVLPNMFGANGLRRYIVLFVQPSESREFGGFVGAYGLLEADQGQFTLVESGSIDTDLGVGKATFSDPTSFPQPYVFAGPSTQPQNLTATADLSTIANAIRDLVPQWRQDPNFLIDGLITIDPYALAGMLELTGPLDVDGRDEPITADNVVDFLLRDQYLQFQVSERDQRQEVLRELAGQAFNRLFAIDIPGPERLGSIFGPAARSNRLSMVTFNEQENAFLDRIFLSADLPQVGSAVDMVGIYGQTGTASKLDGYATRTTTYDVQFDPATGQVAAKLVIVESNNAPRDSGEYVLGRNEVQSPGGGMLEVGDNLLALGLYTRATVDSFVANTPFRVEDSQPAFTYDRYPIYFEVPLGGSAQVAATLSAQLEPGRYDVFIPAQATAIIGDFTLTIHPTEGWRVSGVETGADGSWSQTFPMDQARCFSFTFERVS
jgi:hypothetical protein